LEGRIDGTDWGGRRGEGKVDSDSWFSSVNNRVPDVPFPGVQKPVGLRDGESLFGYIKVELPLSYPSRNIK
jgi:hypothetical protein